MRLPIVIGMCVLVGTSFVLHAQQPPAAQPSAPTPAAAPLPAEPAATPAKAAPAAPAKTGKAEKPKSPPAKEFFGAAKTASPLAARAIGFYAKGCLAGGKALPVDGPAWQAMRLSRNRNWGHPELVELVKRLANEAKQHDGWSGLLVGDLAQPRGGPMTSGHASHQVGLDADIWLTPMPDRKLTEREREDMSATSMLKSWEAVDPEIWTERHAKLIKRAATYAEVERIFVHPAIKKALCQGTPKDGDRGWLGKVRPMFGHNYHFHIRIHCPKGSTNCEAQPPVGHDDGCGQDLTKWLALVKPKPRAPAPPPGPTPPPPAAKPPITIDELPADCRSVLASGPDGAKLPDPVKPAPANKLQKSAGAAKGSKTK